MFRMNCAKLVLLSVGLVSKWKEIWECRDLQNMIVHFYRKMVLAKMQKEELFEELKEAYAKIQHMIRVHSKNPNLHTERRLLKNLYLEFTVDLLLDIEQSLSSNVLNENADHMTSSEQTRLTEKQEKMHELRKELRRLEFCCPSRGVLEEHRERLKEIISWYKIQKVRHLSHTITAIYYEEIKHAIECDHKTLRSHYGNYFDQNIIFKIFGELGTLCLIRNQLVRKILYMCQKVADGVIFSSDGVHILDRVPSDWFSYSGVGIQLRIASVPAKSAVFARGLWCNCHNSRSICCAVFPRPPRLGTCIISVLPRTQFI